MDITSKARGIGLDGSRIGEDGLVSNLGGRGRRCRMAFLAPNLLVINKVYTLSNHSINFIILAKIYYHSHY